MVKKTLELKKEVDGVIENSFSNQVSFQLARQIAFSIFLKVEFRMSE